MPPDWNPKMSQPEKPLVSVPVQGFHSIAQILRLTARVIAISDDLWRHEHDEFGAPGAILGLAHNVAQQRNFVDTWNAILRLSLSAADQPTQKHGLSIVYRNLAGNRALRERGIAGCST